MKDFFKGNMMARVLSVVAACLLWLFVMNEQNPLSEMTYTIPLEQRNLTGNLLVFNAPESVRVRVRGPRTILSGVLAKDIKAYIDLKGLGEGRFAVKVHTQAPLPVEVMEVSPDQVMLRTDTYLERFFPVELQFIGDPTADVTIGKTLIVPDRIKISGPGGDVSTVVKVAARVNLQNRGSEFTDEVRLIPLGPDGAEVDNITIQPEKAQVTAQLFKQLARGNLPIKPTTKGFLAPGFQIASMIATPDKAELTAVPDVLAKMNQIDTEAFSLEELVVGDNEREVSLVLPTGVTSPISTVKIKIQVKKIN